jgi:hypothetical protein
MRGLVRVLLAMAVVVAALVPHGCGGADGGPVDATTSEVKTPDTSGEAAEAPIDDQAAVVPLEDSLGRTPGDAFEEHIAAVGTGDPAAVWETYGCSPPTDFDTWAMEWEDAAEVYTDVVVHEERVDDDVTARVRVTYTMSTGDDAVIVTEPGEWWRVEKVDGVWKVGWLPRQ